MNYKKIIFGLVWASMSLIACSPQSKNNTINMNVDSIADNPLLKQWEGANGGFPAFDKINLAHFRPAIEFALDEQMADVDKIINNPEAPSFANTIEALERSGRSLGRLMPIYAVWSLNLSDSAFRAIEQEMDPKITLAGDKIFQNEQLFARVKAVKENPDSSLTSEQLRLIDQTYKQFISSGVMLDSATKAKVCEINQRLAVLFSQFSECVTNDEGEKYIVLNDSAEIQGLAPAFVDAAAEVARQKGEGKWIIMNTRSSVDPFLTYSQSRDARRRVYQMFASRGDNADKNDTKQIISEIVGLRTRRAKLMGYQSHSHYILENTMAKTPERANDLMNKMWSAAKQRVAQEVADMQAIADAENAGIKIEPWDYLFYAEKVRLANFNLDNNLVKEYLQLDKMREAMFWVAGNLFDIRFQQIDFVPVFHSDVVVYEVFDNQTNNHIGYWYFDPFARKGKRSGAWMMDYRNQSKYDGVVPSIVSNNANFVKPKDGEPILISWDDAVTIFHEFGHALHGLLSDVNYPSLAGTNVVRDYVEFPSQFMERWLCTPEVLKQFAINYRTGEPMPDSLIAKIKAADTFNKGYTTTEYLACAILDMKLHSANLDSVDVVAFERQALAEIGMPKEIGMRHRLPHFLHLFDGDGYSSGYYSYIWSEVLSADAFEAFTETGNTFDKNVACRLKQFVFTKGNSIEPEVAYRQFRGKNPEPDALMRSRGFGEKK